MHAAVPIRPLAAAALLVAAGAVAAPPAPPSWGPGIDLSTFYERAATPPDPAGRALAEAAEAAGRPKLEIGEESPYEEFLAIARVMMFLRSRHADPATWHDLAEGALKGMVSAMDPFSEYMSKGDYEAFEDETEGRVDGIGVTVSEADDGLLGEYAEPDSPAAAAGLLMGDVLTAVDGRALAGMDFDEAVALIGGEPGSEVALAGRHDNGDDFEARAVRDALRLPTVGPAVALTNGVGFVYVREFGERTPAEFREALEALDAGALRGLVLDLRDNPGGLISSSTDVAGHFLPADALIARTKGRVPEEDDVEYRSRGRDEFPELRLAVLVNGWSASAAELLAGALQDHGRALLAGERTFGKASVQNFFDLPFRDHATLKLTTARYLTPNGRMVHGAGIEPDLVVRQGAEEADETPRRRLLLAHPELAPPALRSRILSLPDRPLDAAVEWILSTNPVPAAASAPSPAPPEEAAPEAGAPEEAAPAGGGADAAETPSEP